MQVEDLDLEKLSEEDKAVLFWLLCGTKVRRWTEAQEVMALLGELSCPEGHTRDISYYWADGESAQITKKGVKVPTRERLSHTEGFDIPQSGFECCYCDDEGCKGCPSFFVPSNVLAALISNEWE